jgi:Ni/Fe-hydrogenase 1 B-type cytochrome subunit
MAAILRPADGAPAPDPDAGARLTPGAAAPTVTRRIDASIPGVAQRVRVYVWEIPVRVSHWLIFGSVVVMSVTGFYIADPFLLPPGGSVMMSMRAAHMLAAFVLIAAAVLRTYWLLAGNRFAHWRAFIPTSRQQLRELVRQTGWYLFLRPEAPKVLGHNQLAAGTYLVVFVLFGLQMLTGLALVGVHGIQPWAALFGWVPSLLWGEQGVRLLHHLLMWAILAFLIHHLYSAVLVDHWERNGLMSSMFSGYKFVTRGEVVEARDGGIDVEEVIE